LLVLVAAPLLAGVVSARPSLAQVGNDPRHSPYRDLRGGMGPLFMVGHIWGDRGRVPVGHSNGQTFTVGWEASVKGPTQFVARVTYALTERYVVDPFKDDSVRRSGPFDDDMLMIDLGLRFSLTGQKTWKNLSPYLIGTVGLAVSEGSPVDSGGYRFGKKLTFAPGVGMRWYPRRNITVTADLRTVFWRLRYPPDYHAIRSPDGIPVLPPDEPRNDWTTHPLLSFGVGWTF
jgi:hypothetical protein